MELRDALTQRRMSRSFDGRAVDPTLLEQLCAEALRAPTAGNTAGVEMVVIEKAGLQNYFNAATDSTWRENAARAPGLLRAGAAVVVTSDPALYVARYAEADKQQSALSDVAHWTVPYWHTDAAMAAMALLLLVEEAGIQATIWGNFRYDRAVLEYVGATTSSELFGSLLVGYSDGKDHRSRSLERTVRPRIARVRRLGS